MTAPRPAPLPAIEPLELLYVTNGSMLTAERWWQAHRYYQHRQNLHYQSLHQPGIVCGLGVRVIAAPDTVPSELRDRRWVEIQPGIAIDLVGNPLVVDEPMTFRITAEVIEQAEIEQSLTVYVVLAYVDPTAKQWSGLPADVVKEEFRINERTTPPGPDEIELCRINLTSNVEPLQDASNVLNPASQALDLRYRQRVQMRSQQSVQVGLINPLPESPLHARLTSFLQAVESLYPPLAAPPTVQSISLTAASGAMTDAFLPEVTLLVLPYAQAIALSTAEIDRLQAYLNQGSTLLIEYDDQDTLHHLSDLHTVQIELQAALADLQTVATDSALGQVRQSLIAELSACETTLQTKLQTIVQPLQQAQPWNQTTLGERLRQTPDQALEQPSSALIQTPFLFDELPPLPTGPLHLLTWEGIVLIVGPLSAAWTRQQFDQPLCRSTLRSAQELGINILHQASQRQQMIQAQQGRRTEDGRGRTEERGTD